MPVRRAHRNPESMVDVTGAERLVVTYESGKNSESRRVGRRPSLRPSHIGGEVEHRTRARLPAIRRRVPTRRPRFEEEPSIAVEHEQVPISVCAAAGHRPFDEIRLGFRFFRNGIAALSWPSLVAFLGKGDERDGYEWLARGDGYVRNSERRRAA